MRKRVHIPKVETNRGSGLQAAFIKAMSEALGWSEADTRKLLIKDTHDGVRF